MRSFIVQRRTQPPAQRTRTLRGRLLAAAALAVVVSFAAVTASASASISPISVPAGSTVKIAAVKLSACDGLTYGYQLDAGSTNGLAGKGVGCFNAFPGDVILGPYASNHTLRLWLKDTSCGDLFFSDGPHAVASSGTNPYHVLIADGGGVSFFGSCLNPPSLTVGAGNLDAFVTVFPPPDSTPPAITADVSGTVGNNDWYTSDVSVKWNVSDSESAVSSTNGCGDTTLSQDTSTTTITCTATSAGGTGSKSVTIKRDATAPRIALIARTASNANGWNAGDVSLAWSCQDDTSGPTTTGDSATVSNEGTNQSATGHCSDNAGNSSSDDQTGINIDKTPPSVSYSDHAASYTVADSVSFSCSAGDALSGVDSSTCQDVRGDGYTFSLGNNAYSASATDRAGNTGSASTSFEVTVGSGSLCSLTKRWVGNAGIANALCAKLDAANASNARNDSNSASGQLDAYRKQVSAQSGKGIPADKAAILTALSRAL